MKLKYNYILISVILLKTAVLIPCYNEAISIKKVIEDFKKELPHADIYVYDNNSTDGTDKIAREAGAIVRYEYKQGKGNVIRTMFQEIEADCYIMVDGDGTYPAEAANEIEELILSHKADMVVGDRLSSTYFEENKRLFHNTGNLLVRKIINSIFNSNLSDIMTGMRGFNYQFVKSYPVISKEFEIETEMTIFALNYNFKIEEIPINYKDRVEGSESKLNTYSDGFKVIKLIFFLFCANKPLLFFSICSNILLLISLFYFLPILFNFIKTGYVDKIPTLIIIIGVVVIAFLTFLCGVVLHILKNQDKQNFEHFLTLLNNKQKEK